MKSSSDLSTTGMRYSSARKVLAMKARRSDLNSQHTCKKSGLVVHTCKPSAGEADRGTPEACEPVSTGELGSSGFSERLTDCPQKPKWNAIEKMPTTDLWPTNTETQAHIQYGQFQP